MKAGKYNTDKGQAYLDNYKGWFDHLKNKKVNLLELGILNGGSLLLWEEYFKKGKVVGLDINPVDLAQSPRIKTYVGRQENLKLLKKIAKENASHGFDIIIDDASHIGTPTKEAFWYLFDNHLKNGGIYIIEDWGTGYWSTWPDGSFFSPKRKLSHWTNKSRFPSHDYGLVGFIKQLVDELAMGDITTPGRGIGKPRPSKFSKIELSLGQAAIFKQ